MPDTLDLRLLRTFVSAARSGSLSAAAVQVLRTQSAVTMQIQRLEDALGQKLLHRSGSGVRPTNSGERFLVYAERILRTHDDAVAEYTRKGIHGSISFGCPEDYLVAFGPALLQRFGAAHPAVEVTVVAAPTTELRKLLGQQQVDVALMSSSEAAASGSILRKERLVWVANRADVPLADFGEPVPLALSSSNTLDHKAACAALEKAGIAYRVSFASDSMAGLIAIARSGLAISVFTQTAVPPDLFIQDTTLPALPEIGLHVGVAQQGRSVAVTAFAEHVRRLLPQL